MSGDDALPADDDPEIARLASASRTAAGYRAAARRAIGFARRYRLEEGRPGGTRERACVEQALAWRAAAREALAGRERPGLARTRPAEAGARKTA